jgi:hypothetical protein
MVENNNLRLGFFLETTNQITLFDVLQLLGNSSNKGIQTFILFFDWVSRGYKRKRGYYLTWFSVDDNEKNVVA